MTTKAMQVTALVLEGKIDEAVEIARRSDAASQALRDAGYTEYGLPVRPPCPCWFYERAPSAHDQFLDMPDMRDGLKWSVILNALYLDDGYYRIGEDPHFLFSVPEEIKTFFSIHKWRDTSDVGYLCRELPRLAEQARWGRMSGRKLAMVHGVPGLDPDYRDRFGSEVAS